MLHATRRGSAAPAQASAPAPARVAAAPLLLALLLAGPAAALLGPTADPPLGELDRAWAVALALDETGGVAYVTGRGLAAEGIVDYVTAAVDVATGEVRWVARHDGPMRAIDWAVRVAKVPHEGPVVVTGMSMGKLVQEYATVAYDPLTGDERWAQRYHGPRGRASWSVGQDIAASPAGDRVFVTGLALPEGGYHEAVSFDFDTAAYEAASGFPLWLHHYNGPGDSEDWGYAADVTPDGRWLVVTGRSWGGPEEKWDYATLALDADSGGAGWVRRYDGPGRLPAAPPYGPTTGDWTSDVAIAPDGGVAVVTGRSWGDRTNYDIATIAYDLASGEERWVARHDGAASGEDGGHAVAFSPSGAAVYVAGWSGGDGGSMATPRPEALLLALDAATGEVRWETRGLGDASAARQPWAWDLALAVAADPEGARVYAAGWRLDADGRYAYRVAAHDAATGAPAWQAALPGRFAGNADGATRFNGPGNNLDTVALALTPDGGTLLLAATTETAPGRNALTTAALDPATGDLRWLSRADGKPRSAAPQGAGSEGGEAPRDAATPPAANPGDGRRSIPDLGVPLLAAGAALAAASLRPRPRRGVPRRSAPER